MNVQLDPLEREIRKSIICLGCNATKETGTMTCWNCFKYRTDIIPYKYFTGTFDQWLKKEINKETI